MRRWWKSLRPDERGMVLLLSSPVWAMIPGGYALFGIFALFGWYPEGGWLS